MFEINAVIDNKQIKYPDYNHVLNLNIVQGEANVTKIIFKVLNTELSQKDIKSCNLRQINYENDKGEQHVSMITDIEFEPDFTLFSWNINGLFTALQGKSRFSVSFGNIIEDKITVLFSTLFSEIKIAKSIMVDGDHVTVDATEMQKVLADVTTQTSIATSKAAIATEQATVAVQKAGEATIQANTSIKKAAEATTQATKATEQATVALGYKNSVGATKTQIDKTQADINAQHTEITAWQKDVKTRHTDIVQKHTETKAYADSIYNIADGGRPGLIRQIILDGGHPGRS